MALGGVLGDIVVGPGFQPGEDVGVIVPDGQHQDRHAGDLAVGADRPADFQAAHVGQIDVENDDVRPDLAGLLGRIAALGDLVNCVAGPAEDGSEQGAIRRAVIDDQDGRHQVPLRGPVWFQPIQRVVAELTQLILVHGIMIDEKDATVRDDPALVTVRLNGIIRARSSVGTHSSNLRPIALLVDRGPLPDLTAPEVASIMSTTIDDPERQSLLPCSFEPYRDLPDAELEERILLVKQRWGDSAPDPGAPLSAGRGHPLRRSSRRQLQALEARRQKARPAARSSSAAFISWPKRPTSSPATRSTSTCPTLSAGCSMADMADLESVEAAWHDLGEVIDINDIMPVTYINSSADLKAFCGRHGGIVCTSSNARAVLEWSFARGTRVLFFPDQHLGRNTARRMGIPLDQMTVWDPREPLGGNTPGPNRFQPGHALERPLLGPPDVQARSRTAIPAPVSRQPRSWSIPNA